MLCAVGGSERQKDFLVQLRVVLQRSRRGSHVTLAADEILAEGHRSRIRDCVQLPELELLPEGE